MQIQPLPRLLEKALTGNTLRFEFGKNWTAFLSVVNDSKIDHAAQKMAESLGDFAGKSVLDVGCGSGIHSLAAVRLGAARVVSFDYDQQSVDCSLELKRRFAAGSNWKIEHGSALDPEYLRSLGQFDIVYSWGVLHHTGNMWQALDLITIPAKDKLLISIYADQGAISRVWHFLKRQYSKHPSVRKPIEFLSLTTLWGPKLILKPHRVISDWRNYETKRGMSPWHDVVDWAGGYPFEVATPEQIIPFFKKRGFELKTAKYPRGIIRVNEFVFCRVTA